MLESFVDTPMFGFCLTFVAYQIGLWISRKLKSPIFNPLIIAILIIMGVLTVFDIPYEVYNQGGSVISFFLGPATVALAIPLYRQLHVLKESGFSVAAGIFVGSIASVISVIYLGKLFGLDSQLITSLAPKSVTAAISREISQQLNGLPALTVACTVLTGITGNVIGPYVCQFFKIKDPLAMGTALGTASHAIGTARAMQYGEIEGAMGSLSISVAGIITVFIAPLLVGLLVG